MIDIRVEGLERAAALGKIVPTARTRVNGGALRAAANAIAEEGNRRVHSPRGHARTFKVHMTQTKALVTPGSRANFFSQRYRPVLKATVSATHSRVQNLIRDAVASAVREALR